MQDVLRDVSRRISAELGMRCSALCRPWPVLRIRMGRGTHRFKLIPALDCQLNLSFLPGFHLVRLGARLDSDPGQDRLLRRFFKELFVHEGWRRALSALAASPQERVCLAVERVLLLKRCNQRCRFCGGKEGRDLSWPQARAALDDIRRKHARDLASVLLVISGGEPTLAPYLPGFIRRALSLGIRPGRVLLTTNGVRLADPAYASALQEAGLTRVEFAFHSHEPRTYDFITGTCGHFRRAEAGLRQALARFEVTVNVVINRYNYRELPGFVRYLHRLRDQAGGRLRLMPSIVVMEMAPSRGADWDDVSIPCSRLAPYLVRAVRWDHAQPQRVFIERFEGQCYPPICVGRSSPEFLEHAPAAPVSETVAYIPAGRAAAAPDGGRVKAASCRRCRYDPFCLGVTPVYAARYGFGEFSPLSRAHSKER